MKALSLTQPWASLMALGEKHYETRSWNTKYRGELIIHAAKGFPREAKALCDEEPFRTALAPLHTLPLSRGLCVVRVVNCISTYGINSTLRGYGLPPLSMKERAFGDYGPNRFAWITEFVRPLPDVGPVRGALGLWTWPEGRIIVDGGNTMDTKKYKATPEQLQNIALKLHENGFIFDPQQPTGEASAKGFDIQWQIDSEAGTLAVSVVKHPFGEEGFFWNRVQEELGEPISA